MTSIEVDSISKRHEDILKDLSNYNFNLFDAVNVIGRNKYMPVVSWELMKINKIDRQIKQQEFIRFMSLVYNRYQRHVLYHNDLHGVDVAQHLNFMINSQGVDQICKLNAFDRMALLVSAVCHDMQHDGFTNGFHKNNKSILQQKFGDFHIQEYFHASQALKLLELKECDFVTGKYNKNEIRILKKRILTLILGTDMS